MYAFRVFYTLLSVVFFCDIPLSVLHNAIMSFLAQCTLYYIECSVINVFGISWSNSVSMKIAFVYISKTIQEPLHEHSFPGLILKSNGLGISCRIYSGLRTLNHPEISQV